MKVETEEKNGLLEIRLDAENREDTAFLHHIDNAGGHVKILLHRGPRSDYSTLTLQVVQ